ncbi:MAG: 30S ribosomal protein S6 [Candidatus Liptonbacteria bacterium]|nr:30S ribosomal protein S6 [Candidatus Liptonbacteria bacterium]
MTQSQEKEAREYEVAFLVRDEAAAQEVAAKAAQYGSAVTQGPLKRLAFAYPVMKEASGYFGFLRIQTMPESAAQLEKDFQLTQSILRLLVLRMPVRKEKTGSTFSAAGSSSVAKPRRAPRTMHAESSAPGAPLTNEALEKKIEEILQ